MPSEPRAEPSMDEVTERLKRLSRENRRLFHRLMEGEHRLHRLAKAVWRVQEDERRRLAGELHDGLGQELTALKIQIERLAGRARDSDPALASELEQAAQSAHHALDEARRLSHVLRPRVLDDLGLVPALRWLARMLEQRTGFVVELEVPSPETDRLGSGRLDTDLESLIFRVTQEALTNALKHSGSRRAEVRLEMPVPGHLRLRVRDSGRGFDVAAVLEDGTPNSKHDTAGGLRGMRDRAAIFGGRLEVTSRPGEGTSVELDLPLAGGPTGEGESGEEEPGGRETGP